MDSGSIPVESPDRLSDGEISRESGEVGDEPSVQPIKTSTKMRVSKAKEDRFITT